MNVFCFTLALLLPIIMGFLVVSLCWPAKKLTCPLLWCQLYLSAGIGLGISSLTSFLTLLLAGSTNILVTFLLEAGLISLFAAILWYRKQALFPTLIGDDENTAPLTRILAIAFYVSLVLAIGVFVLRSIENPHGEPDAFYLWNSCARFLFRSGEHWRSMFTANTWSHPNYPLLVPANVWRLWSAYGKETLISPTIIAFLFTYVTIGLLVSALWLLRGPSQAYIGGIILTSTPYFIKHGASQYADVPLGCYILSTLILIALCDEYSEHIAGIAVLTGISLGCAVWTKNEGILFLFTLLLASLLATWGLYKKETFFRKTFIPLLCGLLPFLIIAIYFKIAIAPPNDLVSGQHLHDTFAKLTNLSRYLLVIKAFMRQMIEPYSLVYSTPLAIFVVYALLVGVNWSQFSKPGVLISLLTVLFMLIGYFFIYIITPHDLAWHLETSLSRLFLQLWSGTMFIALIIIATPQEQFSKGKGVKEEIYEKILLILE